MSTNTTGSDRRARVSEDVVKSIVQPEFTRTWHPYSHAEVLNVLETARKDLGFKVVHRQYSLANEGLRMTGAWGIDTSKKKGSEGHHIYQAIIFRNSMDKSCSFGIAGGTDTWVCENLMIVGNYIEFRKHSATLDVPELQKAVFDGITALKPRLKQTLAWHTAMNLVELTEAETKALAYDAIQGGIISKHKVPTFHNLLFGENHTYDPLRLYGFHGASTEVMRDMSIANLGTADTGGFHWKQKQLHQLIFNRYGEKLPTIDGVEEWFNKVEVSTTKE